MDTLTTRHDVRAEQDARRRLEEHVAALVDAAPPLTPEQISRLRELLGYCRAGGKQRPTSQETGALSQVGACA